MILLGGKNFGNDQSKKIEPSRKGSMYYKEIQETFASVSTLDHVKLQEEDGYLQARTWALTCLQICGCVDPGLVNLQYHEE